MDDIIERLEQLENVFDAEGCEEAKIRPNIHAIHFNEDQLITHAATCRIARQMIEQLSATVKK